MKQLLSTLLTSTLLLGALSPLYQVQATQFQPSTSLLEEIQGQNLVPSIQKTLGGPTYYSNYTMPQEYLQVLREVEENGISSLPTEPLPFHQEYADTTRALAGNRTVYHQILNQITSSSMSNTAKVKAIYDFPMYNFVRYDTSSESLPSASLRTSYDKNSMTTLDRGSWLLTTGIGGCQEFSTLFNRLMNTAGFPTFNAYGDYISSNGNTNWHAFSRAQVNGTWYWYDVDVEGSVYRRGTYSAPIYYLYQKSDSNWKSNHSWNQWEISVKQQEIQDANYLPPSTIFSYEGETEIRFQDQTFSPTLPLYGFADVDSDLFSESVLLLPFFEVFEFLGLTSYWDHNSRSLVLEEGENTYQFKTNSYSYTRNGVAQNMAVPIQVVEGEDYISSDDLLLILGFDLNMQFYQNKEEELVTVANFQGGIFPASNGSESSETVLAPLSHGSCGENVTWLFNSSSNTLTISGTGAMEDYDNAAPPWVSYRDQIDTVIVEEGVTVIGWSAFYGCSALTNVYLPNTVTHLEYGAFAYCSSLTSIYLPESLEVIGVAAFAGSSKLKSLTVPSKATTIEDSAFINCSSLSSITMPSTIKYIGSSAFRNCNSLSTVYFGGSSRGNTTVKSLNNSKLTSAKWVYNSYTPAVAPELPVIATIPPWAEIFLAFAQETAMPDLSPSNYSDSITRGLLADCLFRLFGEEAFDFEESFTDGGDYHTAIHWCKEQNIMLGISDTYFNAGGLVTREELALVLHNLVSFLEIVTLSGKTTDLSQFSDTDDIHFWTEDGVKWAVANGLLKGNENLLLLKNNASRLDVAVMLHSLHQMLD